MSADSSRNFSSERHGPIAPAFAATRCRRSRKESEQQATSEERQKFEEFAAWCGRGILRQTNNHKVAGSNPADDASRCSSADRALDNTRAMGSRRKGFVMWRRIWPARIADQSAVRAGAGRRKEAKNEIRVQGNAGTFCGFHRPQGKSPGANTSRLPSAVLERKKQWAVICSDTFPGWAHG